MQLLNTIPQQATGHWVDAILLCILLFYCLEGFLSGAVYAAFDLVKFVASFVSGLLLYGVVGNIFIFLFHVPKGYANALGFFLSAFVTELLLHIILRKIVRKVNANILENGPIIRRANNFVGIVPGLLSGTVLTMFIVTILTALPVAPFFKHAITDSVLGSFFVSKSQNLEKNVAAVFGGAADDTLNFLTVEPQSNTSVSLGFTTNTSVVDALAESEMLAMVNTERTSRGIAPLVSNIQLQTLGENYAQEMLRRGYFSHYTPEGLSPFDRMNNAHISFTYAGENLAFSANVQLAMQGLMNSTGHRENILSKNYHKVGIGVIDAGIYGEMFVQEFTD